MTFLCAKKFGDRIKAHADTKITERAGVSRRLDPTLHPHDKHAEDAVPGALKVFPLTLKLTVGYAGLQVRAVDAIREVSQLQDAVSDLSEVIHILTPETADGEVDFLVISHLSGPQIFKIANGQVSSDQPMHWIGDPAGADALTTSLALQEEIVRNSPSPLYPSNFVLPPYYHEENILISAWTNLLMADPHLTRSIGGIPISVLCSPEGHCFENWAAAYNSDPITLKADGSVHGADGPVHPLYGQYSYSTVPSEYRGAPVFGVWVNEAEVGWLYDLHSDGPERFESSRDHLAEAVAARCLERGGIDIDA